MRLRGRTKVALGAVLALAVCALTASAGTATGSSAAASSLVPRVGTGAPVTGAFTPSGEGDVFDEEFAEQEEEENGEEPDTFAGDIVDRSLSAGGAAVGVATTTGKKAKSNPQFNSGFEGLNFYQQRYARGGNQFSVEPPDQGMCAGNGYIVEAVNDVLNVYNTSGQSVLPDNTATNIVAGFPRNVNHAVDLNSFYGYPPAIDRSTGLRGQFVTDPSCLYDAATQRFFVVVLTLEVVPATGAFTQVNHLDLAVSQTANPAGTWNIYRVNVTNDGTNTGGTNPGPYLGDYPHIGADANGFYITTNAYPWCCNGFSGAQIYAFSKAQLAAGTANVTMQHIDTSGMVNAPSDAGPTQPGFTVWPAQSPGTDSFNTANGGTEYFLSSNAADEATHPKAGTGGDYVSNQIVQWTLTNTSSLNTASPSVSLSNKLLDVGTYAIPPKQKQPGSGTPPTSAVPQGFCLNNETTVTVFSALPGCWRGLVTAAAHAAGPEVISRPDSNDTRMQQVWYANGKVWGALDTAINPDGGPQRAGIAWYVVRPDAGKVALSGYLGATGHDFTYPAIAVLPNGRGLMAFTDTGDSTFPSAAYASIDANAGIGEWNDVPGGQGAAVDDGFTSYKQQVGGNPPRTRWGDYGAAAVDGKSIWIASEYIGHACDYTTWGGPFFVGGTGDNLLGTCAGGTFTFGPPPSGTPRTPGTRAALGNWSTFISKFTP